MATTLHNILIESKAQSWSFNNPVNVTRDYDIHSLPIGSAQLKVVAGKLFADITFNNDHPHWMHLFPHVSFSGHKRLIRSLRLSGIEHADVQVKKIKDQL